MSDISSNEKGMYFNESLFCSDNDEEDSLIPLKKLV